ncbi:MAG: hypothetical protein C0402_11700 [Thermodesulfovibrio sp.]|nr:hypothetical protein [Thermodesulfovibrio sp.]
MLKGILLLLLTLSLLSCTAKNDEKRISASVAPGSNAPEFTAKDLSGQNISLSGLAGRVVVLEFWATWCPPCRSTIPDLVALQEKYRDRNVTVLAVSVDEGSNLTAKLQDFARENKINYSILLGSEIITQTYKVRNIPVLFLIDKTGKIVSQHVGAIEDFAGTVSSQVEKLL